jgi:ketosteroid isomerase-like protein
MNDADKNAETVRRAYAAFNTADMKTLAETFEESASWHTPGRSPVAGDAKGREAVFGPIRPVWR